MDRKDFFENIDKFRLGPDDTFQFRCTMCGKCCIHRNDILLNPQDVFRMSKCLGITPQELLDKYTECYVGPDSRIPVVHLLPVGPEERCPLLDGNKCAVHKAKPAVCAIFPLARFFAGNSNNDSINDSGQEPVNQVGYLLQPTTCGDRAETHTVRGYLNGFGISTDDTFFAEWSEFLTAVVPDIQELEKASLKIVRMYWEAMLDAMYLHYDQSEEFLPQFRKNKDAFLKVVKNAMDLLNGRC